MDSDCQKFKGFSYSVMPGGPEMELEVDMTKIVVLSIISLLTLIGNCLVILAIVARNIKITRQGYFPCADIFYSV